MHVLWETDRWLQKYCVDTADVVVGLDDGKDVPDSETNKAVPATGGGGAELDGLERDVAQTTPRSSLW